MQLEEDWVSAPELVKVAGAVDRQYSQPVVLAAWAQHVIQLKEVWEVPWQ